MVVLLRLLFWATALVLGIVALVAAIEPPLVIEWLGVLSQALPDPPTRIISAAIGALLLLLPLAIAVRRFSQRRYAREISYQTEHGEVSVSLQAIEEALVRAIEQDPAVRKVQLRVYDDRVKRQASISCVLTLWDDGDVTGINRRCQDLVRNRFAELMPEQNDVHIHINVHRLTQRPVEVEQPVAPDTELTTDRTGMPLPGLLATQGQTNTRAGAALLATKRRQSTESRDGETASAADEGAADPVPEAEDRTEPTDEEDGFDPMADLYVGPRYTVEQDNDEDDDERR